MTLLTKVVKRESTRAAWDGRPIIVTLEPGDILGFRAKGTRKTFYLSVASAYLIAARAEVEAAKRERQRRRGGERDRR